MAGLAEVRAIAPTATVPNTLFRILFIGLSSFLGEPVGPAREKRGYAPAMMSL
jgi:hypothetical protein